MVRIVRNPFYCGSITHSLIPGEIHRGKHPALVPENLFIAANEVAAVASGAGIAKRFKIDDLPLKIFAKADTSPTLPLSAKNGENAKAAAPLTGYRKKGIYYYKSRGKGPAINVNAGHLNKLFSDQLSRFEYDKRHTKKLQEKITLIAAEKLKDHLQEQTRRKKQLTQITSNIEKLEERFIKEEISKELFDKYDSKYKVEKNELEEKLAMQQINSSNLENIIEKGLSIASNISKLWASVNL